MSRTVSILFDSVGNYNGSRAARRGNYVDIFKQDALLSCCSVFLCLSAASKRPSKRHILLVVENTGTSSRSDDDDDLGSSCTSSFENLGCYTLNSTSSVWYTILSRTTN